MLIISYVEIQSPHDIGTWTLRKGALYKEGCRHNFKETRCPVAQAQLPQPHVLEGSLRASTGGKLRVWSHGPQIEVLTLSVYMRPSNLDQAVESGITHIFR